MYLYRMWQQSDLPWLEQRAAAAAWEGMSHAERASVPPAQLAVRAAQQVRETLSSPAGTAVIVTRAMRPVGFLLGMIAPDSSTGEQNGHLLTVWVDPAHRRQGLARHLQTQMEEMLARAGVRKVKLWTGLHNQAFVGLAQQMGYKPEGLIGMKQL